MAENDSSFTELRDGDFPVRYVNISQRVHYEIWNCEVSEVSFFEDMWAGTTKGPLCFGIHHTLPSGKPR